MNPVSACTYAGFAGVWVAQTAKSQTAISQGALWIGGVLAGFLLLGALAVVAAKLYSRRIRQGGDAPGPAFSLDQLRRLCDRGELTPAEYEVLRNKLIGADRMPKTAADLHHKIEAR